MNEINNQVAQESPAVFINPAPEERSKFDYKVVIVLATMILVILVLVFFAVYLFLNAEPQSKSAVNTENISPAVSESKSVIDLFKPASKTELVSKTFSLENKTYSIDVPSDFTLKFVENEGLKGALFYKPGAKLAGVVIIAPQQTKLNRTITCALLKENKVFDVNIVSLNETFEVCQGPVTTGISSVLLDIIHDGFAYNLSVQGKEDYMSSSEGIAKVQQILSSFKINN